MRNKFTHSLSQLSLYHSFSLGSSAHASILSLNDEYWIKSTFLPSFILTVPCKWPMPGGQTMFPQRSIKPRLSEDIHEAAQKWRAAVINIVRLVGSEEALGACKWQRTRPNYEGIKGKEKVSRSKPKKTSVKDLEKLRYFKFLKKKKNKLKKPY